MYGKQFQTQDISKSSFLIKGGAGFIGSNIVTYLMKYNAGKVIVLDNLSNGYLSNISQFIGKSNFEFIEGDITDLDTCKKVMEGVDYISHQAAWGLVSKSIESPAATNLANTIGFLNILTAAKDSAVKRIIFASSSANISLAQELINYNPEFGLDDGIAITIDWFKKEFVN